MSIRIKVDEDLPVGVAERLSAAKHDAVTVVEETLTGTPDEELWNVVQREKRCLFTADKGFANAQLHPLGTHNGIVLLRLARESRSGYVRLIDTVLDRLDLESVSGAIVVVTPEVIRIHRRE